MVPLYLAHHGLVGLKPLEPGFKRFEVRPQLGDLEEFELTTHTVQGPITLRSRGKRGGRDITLVLPANATGELVVPKEESVNLPAAPGTNPPGHSRFGLPQGSSVTVHLTQV